MRLPRRARSASIFAVVAIVLAGAAAATLQHIPAGRVGLSASHRVPSGWTLHAPFVPLPTIALQGELTGSRITLRTPEGSSLGFDLELRYVVGGAVAAQLVADIRGHGLSASVADLARRVLEDVARRTDTESLLAEPARVEEPLAAALRAAGLTPERLSFRSAIGDEMIRRRRTDEARAKARDALARMLVVGWDGADLRMAGPLMAAGRMPNLSRLVREGSSGNLRSNDPMFSPLLWTTVATGKAPTEHGIADFLVKDASGSRHPITSDFRRVKALWNILGDFDRTSAWIGWWASFPAESIRGTVVTDFLAAAVSKSGPEAAASVEGVASPAGILREQAGLLVAAAAIPRDEVGRIIPVTDEEYRAAIQEIRAPAKKIEKGRVDSPVAFVMRVLAQARTYHNLALAQLRSGVPFVAVYYEGIDMMGHAFQHDLPPKMSFVTDADFARFHDAVPNFYVWQDERLGELLSASARDAVTVLLSDHGFRTGDDRPNFSPSIKGQPEEWHRDWGIVVLHGPGVSARRLPPSSIFDIAPTLLYIAGLPLADDMPGRPIMAAFDSDLVRRRPPSHTRSYELIGARLGHGAAVAGDPEVMQEMMANLKALGYVGGSDEASPVASGAALPAAPPPEGDVAQTQFFFHRNLAESYLRQGRYAEAETELLQANARQPRAKTYAMLSEVRAARGRFADASSALEEGWARLPGEMEPTSLLWIVELQLLAGQRPAAEAAAARWARKMPSAVQHAVDGRLAEERGDAGAAAELYRQALQEDPLLVRAALRLQLLNAASGRPFAIEPFLTTTLAAHPEVDAYWDLAGQFALTRSDAPSAVERFRHATDIEPENAVYLGHLASAQAAGGRPADARDTLAWADRFPPRDAEGWMALGAAWDRLGETDRAVAAFGHARESSSGGPGPDIGAVLALARAGRMTEARRALDDGLRRYPDSNALRQLAGRLGG